MMLHAYRSKSGQANRFFLRHRKKVKSKNPYMIQNRHKVNHNQYSSKFPLLFQKNPDEQYSQDSGNIT